MALFKCVRYKAYNKGSMQGFADIGVLDAQGRIICIVLGFKHMKSEKGDWLGKPDKERMVKKGEERVGNGTYDGTFYFGESNDTDERKKFLEDEALKAVVAAALAATAT